MADSVGDIAQQRSNVKTNKTINNINVNNVEPKPKRKTNPYGRTLHEAQAITGKLMEALGDSQSFAFYCRVAWNLPEATIWNELEKAQSKGRKPAAYFSTACKAIMAELG